MGELKSIVEELSGFDDGGRAEIIKGELRVKNIDYWVHYFLRGKNIIADFKEEREERESWRRGKRKGKLLITSHFDKVKGSPGANDNASAVAVMLGVANELLVSPPNLPVRLVFFDLEEQSLTGSRAYVAKYGIPNIEAVFNMELVGKGRIPAFWPTPQDKSYRERLRKAGEEACSEAYFIDRIPGRYMGDHESFLKRGLVRAACLTMVPEEDKKRLEEISALAGKKETLVNKWGILRRVGGSELMKNYHTSRDRPENISEESLQMAKQIILGLVRDYDGQANID